LVHRDVKPANILLENSVERVYLTDFGLARASDDASLTCTGVVAGTPHYMSPEQADGQPLDHRSDLFSLGSVLYFMATGHPPFRADRPMAVLKRTCHDPHRPAWQCSADIPDALSEIIDRLLEKNPGSRFASAGDLEKALAGVLADVQQGRIGRRQKPRRRRRTWAFLCGVAAITASLLTLSPFLLPPASNESQQDATVPAETLQAADGAERLQSAVIELNATDRSPTPAAHAELDSLFGLLDALEATPFPEAPLGFQVLPMDGIRELNPDEATGPSRNDSESTDHSATWPMNFRSAPWQDVLAWYSTIAGVALHADEFPDGTFNYADSEQHTLEDITNILHAVLRTKGLLLKRQPSGIQLIRPKGSEDGSTLGVRLLSHDELVERRTAFQSLQSRIADVNKQRDAVPDDAADRDQQLAIIKAKTDALHAEYQTSLRILEAELQEAKAVVVDVERLAQQAARINRRSADCVPQHILLRLRRELLVAQATAAEIDAVLNVGRVIARESSVR
jgi:hypothetical protein